MKLHLLSAALVALLAACEFPGLGPDPRIAQREADAKAIGAGCRHALRGIEDCFAQNEKAQKTAVFEGWKEMDQYMRENKIDGIAPREAKAQEIEEIAAADKKPRAAGNEKSGVESILKPDLAMAVHKPADKVAAKPGSK